MAKPPARRQPSALLPDLPGWLDAPWAPLLPFTRSVVLPERADTEHVTATYDKGILEVSVPVPETEPQGRRIAITTPS